MPRPKPARATRPTSPATVAADAVGAHGNRSASCTKTTSATWGCHVFAAGGVLRATCRRLSGNTVRCDGADQQGDSCTATEGPDNTYSISSCTGSFFPTKTS